MVSQYPVLFHSQGIPLVGRFFRNSDSLAERQPAIVVMGSWLTVKEQMATTYASALAEVGYTTFVFDFAGFGTSHGEPRQAELPARKLGDIRAAVDHLRTLAFVDPERIACVAICASAQYVVKALANGLKLASFASVAGWYHDPASIIPVYGGEAGIELRLGRARKALDTYANTGAVMSAPAYNVGDDRAGMPVRLDYYGQTDRGAIPEWKNEMAEMTWLYWLTFDGLSAADQVTTPALFVHADGCAFPEHVRRVHARVQGPKQLVWTTGNQIDFYDQRTQVDFSVSAVREWFAQTLNA